MPYPSPAAVPAEDRWSNGVKVDGAAFSQAINIRLILLLTAFPQEGAAGTSYCQFQERDQL